MIEKSKRKYIRLLVLFLYLCLNASAQGNVQEVDSVKRILNTRQSDSDKLAVLLKMFRRYKDTDFERATYYSNWMFEHFRNSGDPKMLRTIYFSRGESLLSIEKYDSAIVCYTKALSFSDELGKAQCYFRLGKANDRLGKQVLALSQLKIANTYFTNLESYKNIHGTYDLMSMIYARNGDYDNAIRCIKKKLDLDRNRNSAIKEMEDHIAVASLYGQQNKFNLAFEHLSSALNIAESTKNGFAEIYVSIGNLFFQKKNSKMAELYYNKALEMFDFKKPEDVLTDIYNNLGKVYLKEGRNAEALQKISMGLSIAKKNGFRHGLADAYRVMGQYYNDLGRYDLAMNNLQLCYKTGCNICSRLVFFDVMVEIGDLFLQHGNHDQSDAWYLKSLKLAENFKAKKEMSVAKLKLGSHFQTRGKRQEAEQLLLQSIRYAQESKQPSTTKDIADTLSSFYARQSDFKRAYHYMQLSKLLGDSISRMDGKANMAALEMNFEFESLKKTNEARQVLSLEEIKRQKQFRNFLFIIMGLLTILGLIILYSYRKKMIDNKLLILQKKQIEDKTKAILDQVEEIKSQKDEIERISDRLHETDLQKLRFFSNISHEIRTPLTLIVNPLKMLLDTFRYENEQKHQLELIYKNTLRLHELTNQILDLQKLDSGNLTLNKSNADIVAHLKDVVVSFESFCIVSNCRLTFYSPNSSVFCFFDKDKVTKIISNLLSNAFKYNKVDGEVSLKISFTKTHVSIVVQDSGKGIPSANLNGVFARYYQLEESNTQYEGTGIGLAYVKELTELMKGYISIKSAVNTGTSVFITIPVGDVNIVLPDAISTEFKPQKSDLIKKHRFDLSDVEKEGINYQTILIVEDNADLRNLIGSIFIDNYRVEFAQNGFEGMEKALQYLPDIVISDVMMPQMNGLEMCDFLKKNEQTCHIPIVLLTAKDTYESHVDGYKSGADDYIVKPFDSALLKLKIQNILETREATKKQFSLDNLSEKSCSPFNPIDKEFLRKCVSLINEHMDDPDFSVDSLLVKMAFGRRSLFRKMKALTNMSPYEFILAYKLKHATTLLISGQRVSEVAYSVGFTNAQSFSIAFKKHFGVVPSEYKIDRE